MRFGCCAGPEKADFLQKAGYDYYEPAVNAHLIPEKSEEDFEPLRKAFLSASIKPEAFNCFLPGDLRIIGNQVDEARFARYVETAFRRAGEAGAKIIVFGSGGSRMIPDNFLAEKAVLQMKKAIDLMVLPAVRNRITVAIEGLNKKATNFFNRIDQIEKFTREISNPSIRILADLFHMTLEEEPFFNILSSKDHLAHIHVPVPDLDWIEKYEVRFDHKRFFYALKQAGYDGRVTLEDNGGRIKDWEHDVPHVLKELKKLAGIK